MSNKTRYLIIMVLGVVMNRLFYVLSMHFDLPFWLDMSGTVLAALLLEPTAGLLVGLVNNFGLAVFNYSSSSLIFYAVSASAALVVGVNMRRNGEIDWKRTVPTMGLLVLVTGVLSALLSIWQTGGTLTHPWEVYFYDLAVSAGIPWVLACFIGTMVIKVFDVIATAGIIALLYFVLPNSLKYPPETLMEKEKI
ncbi:hypothetical protein LI142_08925 [Eubacterium limosum]|uniref:hypothetical protein n=1 Tax=Eubacterium limosum TaxID=1736 RepID=UPI001D08D127|nr:hypothetical protein [Eubacterium limosum]MCB6569616.1 hypothetical protein [Eubacterium limosum]